MFSAAAGDQYKWPLLAVLSHAEQPNESTGERSAQESPQAQARTSLHFSPFNSASLSLSLCVSFYYSI